MLHQQIKDSLKDAMKQKELVKLEVIRGILTAFTNELVATKRTPQDFLNDDEALAVIHRLAKQRKDSIEQYRAGDREDLAETEEAELVYINAYLPQMMLRDDIVKLALAKQKEMSLTDPAKKGMLMGALMKDLKGKADGGDVKSVVDEMFK